MLEHGFRGQPLTYESRKNRVLVARRPQATILGHVRGTTQHEISGRVTGENGEPLAGVTVRVKGGTASTMTDSSGRFRIGAAERSEEHTSELQSLMRISYAVFCLKKKKPVISE